MDALDTALGVVQVANTEMVQALRVISVEKGLDPREFALVAFGGAGPLHACALAEELGMTTVLVPRASGVPERPGPRRLRRTPRLRHPAPLPPR